MQIATLLRMTLPALKAALAAERAKGLEIAAELAVARAKASEDEALIAQPKLQIAKLKHQIYGQRSERSSRLIEQLALISRFPTMRNSVAWGLQRWLLISPGLFPLQF